MRCYFGQKSQPRLKAAAERFEDARTFVSTTGKSLSILTYLKCNFLSAQLKFCGLQKDFLL